MISDRQVQLVLPASGFLRRYVDWAHQWIPAPDAYHLLCGMVLLAQTVPADFYFPGERELYPNTYGLLVGRSSTANKGRAIGGARSVLEKALPDVIMDHPGSPEACLECLLDKDPQLIVYEEFGTFLASSEHGQLAPLREKFTDIYDCTMQSRSLIRNLKNGHKTKRVSPRLSVLAGCATPFLETYTLEIDWEGGFLGRFFTVNATYEDGPEKGYGPACEEVRGHLVTLLQELKKASRSVFYEPRCQGRSRLAQAAWVEWMEKTTKRAREAPGVVQAAVARARGHAVKIALLLAWDEGIPQEGARWQISPEQQETAQAISELHIESVTEIAEGLAPDRDGRDVRIMLRAFSATKPRTFGEALARATGLNHRRGEEGFRTLRVTGRIQSVGKDADQHELFQVVVPKSNVIAFKKPEDEKSTDIFGEE